MSCELRVAGYELKRKNLFLTLYSYNITRHIKTEWKQELATRNSQLCGICYFIFDATERFYNPPLAAFNTDLVTRRAIFYTLFVVDLDAIVLQSNRLGGTSLLT